MKFIGTLIIAVLLSCNFAKAQDTLYIYRAGEVVSKRAVADIDSINFYNNYKSPSIPTVLDIDGNAYHTVKIGNQTWMVENLRTTKYRNGDLIGTTLTATKNISSETAPKYQWAIEGLDSNIVKYGRLYTWYAATDIRNIAPTGWHVPNDAEWTILENYLIANGYNYDGSTIGNSETNNKIAKSLAAKSDWTLNTSLGAIGNDMTKNNSTGFTALPAGNRINYGAFGLQKLGGYWWSSTGYDSEWAWYRDLGYNVNYMGRHNYTSKQNGLSIRCIKDSVSKITLPTVTTKAISAITKTSASCEGSLVSNGGTKITALGICWNTTTLPTITNNKTSLTADSLIFTGSITGLSANSTYYVRAYATNNVGTAYGNELIFKTLKDSMLTISDIDGNVYNTITIGKQTWMKENLKTTRYNDSTLIPLVSDAYQWISTTTGAYDWVKSDLFNKNLYGGIYNFYAAASGKLAPKGWHVPSGAEIDSLISYLGGYEMAVLKLKEAGNEHWFTGNENATNSSGFTALPGGYRSTATGDYNKTGEWGVFWSSTELDGLGGRLILRSSSENSDYIFSSKLFGFNVRCIKD